MGKLAGLAAAHRYEPNLAAAGGVGAEEGQGLAVGGEFGRAVPDAPGKFNGGAFLIASQMKQAQLGAAFQGFQVNPGIGESDQGTVGGEGWVGNGLQVAHQVGSKGAGHSVPPNFNGCSQAPGKRR